MHAVCHPAVLKIVAFISFNVSCMAGQLHADDNLKYLRAIAENGPGLRTEAVSPFLVPFSGSGKTTLLRVVLSYLSFSPCGVSLLSLPLGASEI